MNDTFAQLFHVFNMSSLRSALFVNEVTKNKFVWIALLICTGLAGTGVRLIGLVPMLLVQMYKSIWKKKNNIG